MACCVTPASAELRSGPQCSAGFGPGTKTKNRSPWIILSSSVQYSPLPESRVHISRSTIGFHKDPTCHVLLMGESSPPGYCPCCFVLSALYLLFQASFFSSAIPLFKRIYSVYQNTNKGGHASVSPLLVAPSALVMVGDVC